MYKINNYVPMDRNSTSFSTTEFAALVRKAVKQDKIRYPKESTLVRLKSFAYNYRAHNNLPDGLQGYMLS